MYEPIYTVAKNEIRKRVLVFQEFVGNIESMTSRDYLTLQKQMVTQVLDYDLDFTKQFIEFD